MTKYALALCVNVAFLVIAGNASSASRCDLAKIKKLLAALDTAQIARSEINEIQMLFDPNARVVAVSPAKTWDRSALDFAAEKARSTEPAPLAYAFEEPTITCNGSASASVERRGCQVLKTADEIYEITQTERLDLGKNAGTWRIQNMTSHLDAMSISGRQVMLLKPAVRLEICTKAAAN